jgi:hypothetical protein
MNRNKRDANDIERPALVEGQMQQTEEVNALAAALDSLPSLRQRYYSRQVILLTVGLELVHAALERGSTKAERSRRRPSKRKRPRCLARCRSRGGAPCRARVVVDRWPDGRVRIRDRCRLHGGLSTGATSLAGRARLREAGRRGALERWRRWRERRAQSGPPLLP